MFDWGTQELPYPVYHVYGPDKPLWLHLHRDIGSDGAMNLSQRREHFFFVPSPRWRASKIKEDIRSGKGRV